MSSTNRSASDKLTNALSIASVEPPGRASSLCTRNDVVAIERTGVTSGWANCNISSYITHLLPGRQRRCKKRSNKNKKRKKT